MLPIEASSQTEPAAGGGSSRDNFDRILNESIEEAIGGVLGKTVVSSVFYYAENSRQLGKDQIPQRLPEFFAILELIFGQGGRTLQRAIVRQLYVKSSLKFVETSNYNVMDYVERAMEELERRK